MPIHYTRSFAGVRNAGSGPLFAQARQKFTEFRECLIAFHTVEYDCVLHLKATLPDKKVCF